MPNAETKILNTNIVFATNLYLVTHAQTRNVSTEEVSAINGNLKVRKYYTETPTEACYILPGFLSFLNLENRPAFLFSGKVRSPSQTKKTNPTT